MCIRDSRYHSESNSKIKQVASARFGVTSKYLVSAEEIQILSLIHISRILDVGQCNDAYSAIQIALALADAFGCSVNELPLSIILCWFEQKAVCVLLALLALGIRGIRLGPTLPAFLSPGVAAALQQKYDLKPITTPEADLAACLGSHAAD